MPGLHHVGYWVDDLAAAQARWEAGLGVGPFQVIERAGDRQPVRGARTLPGHGRA